MKSKYEDLEQRFKMISTEKKLDLFLKKWLSINKNGKVHKYYKINVLTNNKYIKYKEHSNTFEFLKTELYYNIVDNLELYLSPMYLNPKSTNYHPNIKVGIFKVVNVRTKEIIDSFTIILSSN